MLFDNVSLIVLAAALAADAALGDPRWIWSRIRHPVALVGDACAWLEVRLNKGGPGRKRLLGVVTLVLMTVVAGMSGTLVNAASEAFPALMAVEALILFTLIAQRDLHDHIAAVAIALERDGLDEARIVVARTVGRNPAVLDEAGVSRAAIESCSENFSDGVVAPVFWYLVAGLPGVLIYKTVNTLDSMIGHVDDRHVDFGWASARFDDLLNLVPARLSGLIVALAAQTCGLNARAAVTAMQRDAGKHKSPNAGWPEAAFAGALGISLAGPRYYADHVVNDGWMGDGRADCTADDIRRALRLLVRSCVVWFIISSGLLLFVATWTGQ